MTTIHTCSYYCERPECIKRQRDELVKRMEVVEAVDGRYETPPADARQEPYCPNCNCTYCNAAIQRQQDSK